MKIVKYSCNHRVETVQWGWQHNVKVIVICDVYLILTPNIYNSTSLYDCFISKPLQRRQHRAPVRPVGVRRLPFGFGGKPLPGEGWSAAGGLRGKKTKPPCPSPPSLPPSLPPAPGRHAALTFIAARRGRLPPLRARVINPTRRNPEGACRRRPGIPPPPRRPAERGPHRGGFGGGRGRLLRFSRR